MLRKYKAVAVFITAMILLLAFSSIVKSWLMHETWFLEGNNAFDWLHDLGRYLMTTIETSQHQSVLLAWLFPILFTALILTAVNIATIALFILLRRWGSIRFWHRKNLIREKVQASIIEYLYGNSESALEQMKQLKKQTLVEEIISLRKQITGPKTENLQHLFYQLGLDTFVVHKINSARWFNKVLYIDAAQWMQVYAAFELIQPYQYAGNPHLRNVAQMACVNLDTGQAFAFLNIIDQSLPIWHQILLHKTMVRSSLPLPDFYSFLHSENASVIIFALNMIRLFSQKGSKEEIIQLVTHHDPVVRRNALRVVRDLDIYEAIPVVKQNFLGETLRVQVGMIQALSLDKPQETFEFYRNIWQDTPRRLQAEILKHVSPGLQAMLLKDMEPEQIEQK
ncbi:HEAT repeat domain-containing protein [Paludibacter jiangxiensis]|uniref:HEAT repeat-containing protein n=1 Tax=Paludibacter jiangxiensis TaxID=681398 RepID=A0A161LDM2_9BACT|nr:hypothetical protein [Paludibacter jiangxiensis]GAT62355.1 hypothetical protein PJIAN_1948 [Paludibacter jiangxiensis]